jgi:UDP-N-acetylglucosamine 2-epimerase (non-hydrolysing)
MKYKRFRISLLIGTRPEAIKMAPVVRVLAEAGGYDIQTILSGQQVEMSRAALNSFGLRPNHVLMREGSDFSLCSQAAGYLELLHAHMIQHPADLMLVHGDTTTGFIGALAAFYQRIPLGHVEAGLRSHDLQNPFPEEGNRRLIDPLCRLHFAPTPRAYRNLIEENTDPRKIIVTGNTVVDAVRALAESAPASETRCRLEAVARTGQRMVLVTAHRRENWGEPLRQICSAVRALADRHEDVVFIVPVHPNPNVGKTVHSILADHGRIHLTPPLDYADLIAVMRRACLILTDSGGIQEEAPCLGTCVLVLRKTTERPEVVESGCGWLVGTHGEDILAHASRLLQNSATREKFPAERNPFGDGQAAVRIMRAIDNWRRERPLNYENADFVPMLQ